MKLLICDDDEDCRELLVEVLRRPEYELVVTTSVAEAIQALKVHSFNVLLLDGCLGDGNAWDILELLPIEKARPAVILITGSKDFIFDGARPGQPLPGINAYFSKPCNPRELIPVVRTLCRIYK